MFYIIYSVISLKKIKKILAFFKNVLYTINIGKKVGIFMLDFKQKDELLKDRKK